MTFATWVVDKLLDLTSLVAEPMLNRNRSPMHSDDEPDPHREWEEEVHCTDCGGYVLHYFVIWQPNDVLTKECTGCQRVCEVEQ